MPKHKRKLKQAGNYNTWANSLARKWSISRRELEQDDYDYKGYYDSNPYAAEAYLKGNSDAHFPDTYKLPTHPTFSVESKYSGKDGNIVGGTWVENPNDAQRWTYQLSPEQIAANWNIRRTLEYAGDAEDEGFRVVDYKGRYPVVNGIVDNGILPAVNVVRNKKKEGGAKVTTTRVRRADGSYAYVKTRNGKAIIDSQGRYNLYDKKGNVIGRGIGDSFPYVGDAKDEGYLDEITVTPQGVQIQDTPYDSNALFKSAQQAERNKEIARNKAIDAKVSRYAFTPEGFFGQAMQPMNLLSPTHTGRGIYNWVTGTGYGDMRDLFLPNNGVFSDEFAREHPYLTMAGNLGTDAVVLGAGAALRNMPKYRAALQAENRAAQEAMANQWDAIASRRAIIQTPPAATTNPGSMILFERPAGNLSTRERLGLPKGSRTYTKAENKDFLKQINEFAGKYGYRGLEDGTYTAEELEAYARALIDRHNKFYRGVTMPANKKDIANIKSVLGENATDDKILQYVATHPREGYLVRVPEENGVNWLTPIKEHASIFGDTQNGKTAIVSRHYKLGDDRTKWFNEGDYTMTGGANWHLGMGDLHEPYTEFVTPDGRRFTTSLPARPRTKVVAEVVSDKPTVFRGWANESNPELLSGKYPEVPIEYWQKTHPIEKKKEGGLAKRSLKYGGIHIKPENKGKFTETMRRTGKTAEELSHSSNPLTRKRAIFALNARKWHH